MPDKCPEGGWAFLELTEPLHIVLIEELSYELTKNFVASVPVRCNFFFTTSHFHLAGRFLLAPSISHFLTATMKFL